MYVNHYTHQNLSNSSLLISIPYVLDVASAIRSKLIPSVESHSLAKYAKFEVACSVESANFDPSAFGYAFEMVFKKNR